MSSLTTIDYKVQAHIINDDKTRDDISLISATGPSNLISMATGHVNATLGGAGAVSAKVSAEHRELKG